MLYSILIYVPEDLVDAMSEAEVDAHIDKHMRIHDQLRAQDRLGPVVRLMPTTTAVQLRTSSTPHVVDGPFADQGTAARVLHRRLRVARSGDRGRTLAAERAHDLRDPAGEVVLPGRQRQPDSPTARC